VGHEEHPDDKFSACHMFAGIHAQEVPDALEFIFGDRFPVKFVQAIQPFGNGGFLGHGWNMDSGP
jgi:hypothetical protein